ncbi:hypothetical protein [Calidifontibacter indicus]|uniref:hypothetical protein n=1 Tax=Calidifontibacter indicus TaxID=419650 RepID=UPI000E23E47D|nr:hypothetical protein [Calidifontibacter indicus]
MSVQSTSTTGAVIDPTAIVSFASRRTSWESWEPALCEPPDAAAAEVPDAAVPDAAVELPDGLVGDFIASCPTSRSRGRRPRRWR